MTASICSSEEQDTPLRHQTLEATIAWSHDLLTNEEQVVLRRLSVFAGSFSLEAAEQVGRGGRNGQPLTSWSPGKSRRAVVRDARGDE